MGKMLIIFALLALLSLGVTGLPTNTTDLAFGNATSSKWFNEDSTCFWGGTDMKEMPGDCRKSTSRMDVNLSCRLTSSLDRLLPRAHGQRCGPWLDARRYRQSRDVFANGIGQPVKEYGLGPGYDQGEHLLHALAVKSTDTT